MRRSGGANVVAALEAEGARLLFGIPGTHNIGLYDALLDSSVRSVLAVDERAAAFMADGAARASGEPGVLCLVPGAGATHALSGIAEAWLDQVPLVVLACGIRSDTGLGYQLHAVDQAAILRSVTKAVLQASDGGLHAAVREAFRLARRAPCGPVAVEVPAELYLLGHDEERPAAPPLEAAPRGPGREAVARAAELLAKASRPVLYAGQGCRGGAAALRAVAERLGCPVATTISGKGVFPESHPLSLWSVVGAAAPPFAAETLEQADAWLAVGCRFGEVATGSYGLAAPRGLIHVDIDASVLNRNFRAELAVESDARLFLEALLPLLPARPASPALLARLDSGRKAALSCPAAAPGQVSPAALFESLQAAAPKGLFVADSGNGLFLAMERLRLDEPGRFLAPVDFSCMGYSVPAAIGAKLAAPERDVISVTGDGALLMTGLALVNAVSERAPVLICVLRDKELGQIAQFQRMAFGRTSSAALPNYDLEGLALSMGAAFGRADQDSEVSGVVNELLAQTRAGRPAILEVALDTAHPTFFTRGTVRANFARMPVRDKLEAVVRVASRRLGG